ncbi:SBBP repeat-containing protein [Chitinophagaceae bacterium LB-8]|uniref:SBBP repeat-containing protein n=1 Tax=Paraflavisolibacter caeni TaxID=2982496 RepID=A0A9X2XVT8_9BACT|nr:SBBP repeat-containing protein [Paraflavisolibacter caeni]MCU7549945.1 SBBP repeat-containing protein [Paraflavisolibacter caeni]
MGTYLSYQKALLLLFLCLISFLCFAQVKEQWAKKYNGPGNSGDGASSMAVDAAGNVYVAGLSNGGKTLEDYVIIKYNATGKELWVRRYNGPGNGYDNPSFIALDLQGNLYVTGVSLGSGGESDMDYATIKFDAAGNEQWVKRYNGPANQWDEATSLAVDGSGNVYVSGMSWSIENNYDIVTIKYDHNGNQLWVKSYNGPGNDMDRASSMAVDALENVYVTGNSSLNGALDFVTIKYDVNGKEAWVKSFSGSSDSFDAGLVIVTDAFGNEYVTGYSIGSDTDYDFVTIKYDRNGHQLSIWKFDGIDNSMDIPVSLAVDASGNVYVAGTSRSKGSGDDFLTIKYDANGNAVWAKKYNGQENGADNAASLCVDIYGNVYVTGTTQVGAGPFDYDYATVKYDANGNERWVKKFNGSQKLNDGTKCIGVDGNGNVYVTGYSAVSDGSTDIVTIKYGQTSASDFSCGPKGDKVLVCHKGKTLCVAKSAVAAHLKHGDQLGNCNASTFLSNKTEDAAGASLGEQEVGGFRVSVSPNPFSTSAQMKYELPSAGTVSIKVYNMSGKEVATVVQGKRKAGMYRTDLSAADLGKGVYYYRALLSTGQNTNTLTGKFVVAQ